MKFTERFQNLYTPFKNKILLSFDYIFLYRDIEIKVLIVMLFLEKPTEYSSCFSNPGPLAAWE